METLLFYQYVLIIPVLIILIGYVFITPKPKSFFSFLKFFFRMIPFLLFYGFIVYLLEEKKVLGSGWAFYTYMFFFLTISFITSFIYIFLRIKKKNKGN